MILMVFRLKSRDMSELAMNVIPLAIIEKQEMDQSYEREDESGFQSSFATTSNADSENSWVMHKNEIMDPIAFNPPILQSSNLSANMICTLDTNLSSISGDEPQFKGQTNFSASISFAYPYLKILI